eukprot:6257334-Pyramimonas_sp.AAC.1
MDTCQVSSGFAVFDVPGASQKCCTQSAVRAAPSLSKPDAMATVVKERFQRKAGAAGSTSWT